jgi:hypothetical protein
MNKPKVYVSHDGAMHLFECPGCGYGHVFYIKQTSNHPLWTWNGSLDKPTYRASLLNEGQFRCHIFVTDGMIQFLGDCTHKLANQTVPMADIEV